MVEDLVRRQGLRERLQKTIASQIHPPLAVLVHERITLVVEQFVEQTIARIRAAPARIGAERWQSAGDRANEIDVRERRGATGRCVEADVRLGAE